MTLREALEVAEKSGCITPGAILQDEARGSFAYVWYDEEQHVRLERPWCYFPDNRGPGARTPYALTDEQLERVVLFAESPDWEPVSNLVWE
jgi:hypothetical protein